MTPTIGSLFAGIGGFDLGFERAGFRTAWQVEIDPWCRRVLAKNFPGAGRYADITERFLWDDEACRPIHHDLQPVDVVCAGFPCQDISNAGLRAGIDGRRSGLWSHVVRLLPELRPQFVLLENVAALLGRGLARVLGDLAEIGYDAEWEVVSAADVGAPHLRERVWILAYAARQLRHGSGAVTEQARWAQPPDGRRDVSDTDSGRAHAQPLGLCRRAGSTDAGGHGSLQLVADTASERCGEAWELRHLEPAERLTRGGEANAANANLIDAQGEFTCCADSEERSQPGERSARPCHAGFGGQWAVEPDVGRVAHGVPARVDRLRGLGNAVVPQIPELYARRLYPLVMAAKERAA